MERGGDASRETARDVIIRGWRRSAPPQRAFSDDCANAHAGATSALRHCAHRPSTEGIAMSLPDRALELASQVGEGIKANIPDRALKWAETGAAIGAVRTGAKVATKFVRRNPAVAVAAIAGAGLLWYAARRRAKQAENGAIEGQSRRVEAKRPAGTSSAARTPRTRRKPQDATG
jgi:hypothetical protein